MERRRAMAIAAATAATTVGAITAIAANFGLLGFGQAVSAPVGQLEAGRVAQVVDAAVTPPTSTGTDPRVTVRYEDIYVPVPAAPATTRPTVTVALQRSGFDDDDSDDRSEHDDDDSDEDD